MEIRINLYDELLKDNTDDLSTILKPRLLELFDKLLSEGDVTDNSKLQVIARLRAKIEIELSA